MAYRDCRGRPAVVGAGLFAADDQERAAKPYASCSPLSVLAREDRMAYSEDQFITNWSVRDPTNPRANVFNFGEDELGPGIRLHRSEILIQLDPDVGPGDVAAHLARLRTEYFLEVVDSVPEIGLVVARLGPEAREHRSRATAGDCARIAASELPAVRRARGLEGILAKLRQKPWIRVATPNTLIGISSVPPSSRVEGANLFGVPFAWDWRIGPGTPAAEERDGNWGLKRANFPAAWNFLDAIRRRNDPRAQKRASTLGSSTRVPRARGSYAKRLLHTSSTPRSLRWNLPTTVITWRVS